MWSSSTLEEDCDYNHATISILTKSLFNKSRMSLIRIGHYLRCENERTKKKSCVKKTLNYLIVTNSKIPALFSLSQFYFFPREPRYQCLLKTKKIHFVIKTVLLEHKSCLDLNACPTICSLNEMCIIFWSKKNQKVLLLLINCYFFSHPLQQAICLVKHYYVCILRA